MGQLFSIHAYLLARPTLTRSGLVISPVACIRYVLAFQRYVTPYGMPHCGCLTSGPGWSASAWAAQPPAGIDIHRLCSIGRLQLRARPCITCQVHRLIIPFFRPFFFLLLTPLTLTSTAQSCVFCPLPAYVSKLPFLLFLRADVEKLRLLVCVLERPLALCG